MTSEPPILPAEAPARHSPDPAPRFVLLERQFGLHAVRGTPQRDFDGIEASSLQGEMRPAVALPWAMAVNVRQRLQATTPGQDWHLEPAALPCPSCGQVMDNADGDFIYRLNRDGTRWRAGCNIHDFGCGHEVFADSREAALQKWNRAAPHEGPLSDLVIHGGTP